MNWSKHKHVWPNAHLSRFVDLKHQRWHVQRAGKGRGILLLHGAGGSLHSWRDMLLPLADAADVLAVDLPGQGFTRKKTRGRSGLKHMAEDIRALLTKEGHSPSLIVGHSAGAAIALEMVHEAPDAKIVGINPALMPFQGIAAAIFPPLAKLLALNPLTPHIFAHTVGTRTAVRRLISGTGSHIGTKGLDLYYRLVSDAAHVDGTLRMMASWDLEPLLKALPTLSAHAVFAVGLSDHTVPPETTMTQAARMRDARIIRFPNHGHLMHEEAPHLFNSLCLDVLNSCDALSLERGSFQHT